MYLKNILQHGLSSCYYEFSTNANIECIAFHININKKTLLKKFLWLIQQFFIVLMGVFLLHKGGKSSKACEYDLISSAFLC